MAEKGEGLVLVMPFPGEQGKNWPADLAGLSALTGMDSDSIPAHGYVKWGYGEHS